MNAEASVFWTKQKNQQYELEAASALLWTPAEVMSCCAVVSLEVRIAPPLRSIIQHQLARKFKCVECSSVHCACASNDQCTAMLHVFLRSFCGASRCMFGSYTGVYTRKMTIFRVPIMSPARASRQIYSYAMPQFEISSIDEVRWEKIGLSDRCKKTHPLYSLPIV